MDANRAAEIWDNLCPNCRREICEQMGFLNPIYQHYRFRDFQPHTQRDLTQYMEWADEATQPKH